MDIPEHWKLFQCKNIDTVQLWIFQNTATLMCNYGYSRIPKTVPVQKIDEWGLMNIPEPWSLYQYRTLINHSEYWTLYQYAALIFMNTDDWCYFGTSMNYPVMDMFIDYAVLWSLILRTTRPLEYPCSLDTFMDNMHEHSYNKMTCTPSSVILYKQLSCIIIYKSPKSVNKYTVNCVLTIVWLWHDSALQSKFSLV